MNKKLALVVSIFIWRVAWGVEPFTYGDLFKIEERDFSYSKQLSVGYSTIVDDNLIESNGVEVRFKRRFGLFSYLGADFAYLNSELSDAGEVFSSGSTRFKVSLPTASLHGTAAFDLFNSKINFINRYFVDSHLMLGIGLGGALYKDEMSSGDKMVLSSLVSVDWQFQVTKKYFFSIGGRRSFDNAFSGNSFSYTRVGLDFGTFL